MNAQPSPSNNSFTQRRSVVVLWSTVELSLLTKFPTNSPNNVFCLGGGAPILSERPPHRLLQVKGHSRDGLLSTGIAGLCSHVPKGGTGAPGE